MAFGMLSQQDRIMGSQLAVAPGAGTRYCSVSLVPLGRRGTRGSADGRPGRLQVMSAARFALGRFALGVPRAVAYKEQEVVVSHVEVLEEHEVPNSMFDHYTKADDMLAALEASLSDLTNAMSEKPSDAGFWVPNVSVIFRSIVLARMALSVLCHQGRQKMAPPMFSTSNTDAFAVTYVASLAACLGVNMQQTIIGWANA